MGHINKEIAIGFLVSLLATACGLFLYLEYVSNDSLLQTLHKVQMADVLGRVIALAALPNLFVFFVFLKKNQDYRARGVILGTIFIAFVTLVLKFL